MKRLSTTGLMFLLVLSFPISASANDCSSFMAAAERSDFLADVAEAAGNGWQSLRHRLESINHLASFSRCMGFTSPQPGSFSPQITQLSVNVLSDLPRAYREASQRIGSIALGSYGDQTVYITRAVADDGSIVYYARHGDDRSIIYRYNDSHDSAGYTEVWEYVTVGSRAGYLKARVNIITKNGVRLPSPEQIIVETNDMYPAIQELLAR